MDIENDYWFTIEPYVFINIANNCALLYNTYDGKILISKKAKVIELLNTFLQKKDCGVILLKRDLYHNSDIFDFITDLTNKYMGDIIDISFSKGKPIQILPYYNLNYKNELYKIHNFSPYKSILEKLSEISIYIDQTSKAVDLVSFLQTLPENVIINIISNNNEIDDNQYFSSFLEKHNSSINIVCSYSNITLLNLSNTDNLYYKITVNFPINTKEWDNSIQILSNKNFSFEYILNISSLEDYEMAERLIDQFQIKKYIFKPIYTGGNIDFFKEYVFLTEDDILSTTMSIKDFFANQSINIYEFGKISILPNGDAFANLNHPVLGNIYTHSISEIVQKEVEEGISWFNIRNKIPCNTCIYQWLCPPPSNYEIEIGRMNLCHINTNCN